MTRSVAPVVPVVWHAMATATGSALDTYPYVYVAIYMVGLAYAAEPCRSSGVVSDKALHAEQIFSDNLRSATLSLHRSHGQHQ